jgi:hypothetical protein
MPSRLILGSIVAMAVFASSSAIMVRAETAPAPTAAAPTPPPAAAPTSAPKVPAEPSTPPHAKPDAAAIAAKLPPAANRPIDFAKDIKPLFEASCIQCHARGKIKGGLSLETREMTLKGGESGPSIIEGKSAESLIVHLVAAVDPEKVMPMKGTKWTPEQVGLLCAWIDQGATWDASITFARPAPLNFTPRQVPLPTGADAHPIDRWMAGYFQSAKITPASVVDDRTFARRAYLDSIGLLPTAPQIEAFVADTSADKRTKLVKRLLVDNANYADHWLTFWNDLLRNDYKGTGYIDGGRKQITGWLYNSLLTNKPYDRFAAELVNPAPGAEGFTKGIVWRGNVNASMSPQMQAAQSVSQVFLGVNLKCASCHDSFVSDWTLEDAYSLAAVYSDTPLEMVHCDKPTGKMAKPKFLYPQIGEIDPNLPKAERLKRFAELLTNPANGRLPRTIVNRLWAKLMGRGLVEPLDEMENAAWHPDMLDWLAEDLVANKYNLKRTLEVILTSRAYQMPAVEGPKPDDQTAYAFTGPIIKRMTAEQFSDAVSGLSGQWADFPTSKEIDFSGGGMNLYGTKQPAWVWTDEPLDAGVRRGGWQIVRAKQDEAQRLAAETQAAVAAASPNAVEIAGRAKAASEEAAKLIAEAAAVLESPERAAQIAAAPEKLSPGALGIVRHKVVFRKKFTITGDPSEGYAALAASQPSSLTINGKQITNFIIPANNANRIGVADLRSLLVKGENVLTVSVDSHTENPAHGGQPQLAQHLNGRSGMALYVRFYDAGSLVELTTDPSWHVRRAPEGDVNAAKFDDTTWLTARGLNVSPIDEGPVLDASGKAPANNPGLDLGPRMPIAIATTVRAGTIRSALLASDPLQLAMARPNREVIVPVRSDVPSTIQALEFTNGATVDEKLKRASNKLQTIAAKDPAAWVESIYNQSFTRKPTDAEKKIAIEMLGTPVKAEGVADFLWAITMMPEFQLIN